MKTKQVYVLLLIAVCLFGGSGCSLVGIHLKVKTPRRAGKYPKETTERKLFGGASHYRSCFDVTYYHIDVELFPESRSLKGEVKISAIAAADFDTLQLDLHPNLQLKQITYNGNVLAFNRQYQAVFIAMGRTMHKSETFDLLIQYEGRPPVARKPPWAGGFVWRKDDNKNPWIGVACESEGSSVWWPGKDDVSDEPDSADISIVVPQDLVAVSNGVLTGKSKTTDGKEKYNWHVSYPINTYNISLYVGRFVLIEDTYISTVTGLSIPIRHYVLRGNEAVAKTHFEQAKKHLAFYEQKFGPYPWPRDGYRLVQSPYAGMEHQSAIAYGNGFKNDRQHGFDYIILHETAHEWWGNSVSAADLADAWIHEGFASYSEALYVEATEGRRNYLSYLFLQRILIKNKRPVVHKRGIRYFDYHDGDIYMKGSWVLHTLRNTLENDSLFFDIIKTFRTENHCRQIYSEAFIELVNRKTGRDYRWFFDQYLFRREAPVLQLYWYNSVLYYRWKSTRDDFKLPVTLITDQGKKIKIYPTTKVQVKQLSNDVGNFSLNSNDLYFATRFTKKILKLLPKDKTKWGNN